ncbi:MAG: UDP-glucose 4-epimerase GalE [Rhodothermales bacterium]|nr:UDP-glucose 4-epimerase GalE [Rhodothermales bacterium]
MNVFVSGGAGYIGSATVAHLLEMGHQVLVFDNLSQGHREAVGAGAEVIVADLMDRAAIDDAMVGFRPDAVMHFAAYSLVGHSMQHPILYLRDNVTAGLNLMESAAAHGVRRFILSSTANLFGVPERIPIDEDTPIAPGSPYGESKWYLERALRWMETCAGMRYAVLRYFNACGAISPDLGEHHEPESHLIPLVLQVALGQREAIVVYGDDYATADGTCVRDYIHVVDLARAHVLALGALENESRTYNLGNGKGFSVREVIDTARLVTGHPIPEVRGPRRPGDPACLIASSDRIRRDLGWAPAFNELRPIIQSAWDWHRAHPRGFANGV